MANKQKKKTYPYLITNKIYPTKNFIAQLTLNTKELQEKECKGLALIWAIENNVDLEYADFCCAHLDGMDLSGVSIQGADLTDASCVGTNFTDADLSGVDFTGADLLDADFTNVDLTYIDFSYATMPDGSTNE